MHKLPVQGNIFFNFAHYSSYARELFVSKVFKTLAGIIKIKVL